jgi:hypothetical protein
MSTAQLALTIVEHVWIGATPAATWWALRTPTGRTITTVIRAEIRDLWLRAKGVPEKTRHELAVKAMKRDLES